MCKYFQATNRAQKKPGRLVLMTLAWRGDRDGRVGSPAAVEVAEIVAVVAALW